MPGLYAAPLDRERKACAEIDPRTLPRFNPWSDGPSTVVETGSRSPVLLASLESGEPVKLQGRNLRARSLPEVPLRRDQAFDRFEVRPDDSVQPVEIG